MGLRTPCLHHAATTSPSITQEPILQQRALSFTLTLGTSHSHLHLGGQYKLPKLNNQTRDSKMRRTRGMDFTGQDNQKSSLFEKTSGQMLLRSLIPSQGTPLPADQIQGPVLSSFTGIQPHPLLDECSLQLLAHPSWNKTFLKAETLNHLILYAVCQPRSSSHVSQTGGRHSLI